MASCFVLVDGSNILRRYRHRPDLLEANAEERFLGSLKGFLSFLSSVATGRGLIVKKGTFVVAWDRGVSSFRRNVFPEYKKKKEGGGRKESDTVPPHLREFLPTVSPSTGSSPYLLGREILHERILPSLGVSSVMVDGAEADDIIAMVVNKMGERETPLFIYSSDRDYIQLLKEDKVEMVDAANDRSFTENGIIRDYDLHPVHWRVQWKIYRAICGDVSDGIPGISGAGEKAALQYSQQVIDSLTRGKTFLASLVGLQRPKYTNKSTYEMITSTDGHRVLTRNLSLMDLENPMSNDSNLGKKIVRSLIQSSLIQVGVDSALDLLSEVGVGESRIDAEIVYESSTPLEFSSFL